MSDDPKFGVTYKQEKKIGKVVRKKLEEGRAELDLKEIMGGEEKTKGKKSKDEKAG